jgi:hypothetical protein
MASRGQEERGQEQRYGQWPGGPSQGPRDEDDYPQQGMRGGSVYEEGRGYGQARGGYGSPEAGGFGHGDVGRQGWSEAASRRDYGGGPGGGYAEGGFGSGGYGQREGEQYRRGSQEGYSGAGYGGGEPTYGGYQQTRQYDRPREQAYYQRGGHESQYDQPGQGARSLHAYGQGPEPSSGAYGGAGLGGYSEGTSDIGRGMRGEYYGESRPGRGYGSAGYSQGARYGEPAEGGLWSGIKSGFREMFGGEQEGPEAQQRRGGGFRGRGPKGYQRSDERITDDVCQLLCDDDDLDASDIEVTVNSGDVTLAGAVPDRTSKRRAEDLAERVSGVQNVQNNLRVNREGPGQQQAPATESQATRARARSPR